MIITFLYFIIEQNTLMLHITSFMKFNKMTKLELHTPKQRNGWYMQTMEWMVEILTNPLGQIQFSKL
jgi:hypothetical protein